MILSTGIIHPRWCWPDFFHQQSLSVSNIVGIFGNDVISAFPRIATEHFESDKGEKWKDAPWWSVHAINHNGLLDHKFLKGRVVQKWLRKMWASLTTAISFAVLSGSSPSAPAQTGLLDSLETLLLKIWQETLIQTFTAQTAKNHGTNLPWHEQIPNQSHQFTSISDKLKLIPQLSSWLNFSLSKIESQNESGNPS